MSTEKAPGFDKHSVKILTIYLSLRERIANKILQRCHEDRYDSTHPQES